MEEKKEVFLFVHISDRYAGMGMGECGTEDGGKGDGI